MQPQNTNNLNQPGVIQPLSDPPPAAHARRRWLLIGLILLLVAAAGVAAAVLYNPKPAKTPTTTTANPYKYSYSQLDDSTLQSMATAASMSFSKPVELKESSRSDSEVYFEHSISNPAVKVAYLDAYMASTSNSADPAAVTAAAADKATSDYLKSQLPPTWTSSLKTATTVKLTGQQSGWTRDFTASGSNGRGGTSYWQGRLLYVPGKKADYYLLAMTVNYNWQSNAATWQKVFDSVKIDQ